MSQQIDSFAEHLRPLVRDAVGGSTAFRTKNRYRVLPEELGDPDALRRLAGHIKQHTLENLDRYLDQAAENLTANGATVHFAKDAATARDTILGILQQRGATKVVKSKSMATEEIHLNEHLEAHGVECLETDLGEFIVQLDGDTPSHIVQPIIHKKKEEVAQTFEDHGIGDYNTDPETITRRARRFMRSKYMESDAGITGGNFVSAESGRVAIVTNEGNARFSMAANGTHIALIGIEKVIPRDRDLALFLNLLARSATAQQLTVYTQFINGPKAAEQPDGPEEMHVVFLDNGRRDILDSEFREILRCIRCGACQNVCPVYRQASGHAYRATYGGPIGAVLSPLLAGSKFPQLADLPKASSLCGACNEVCPVDIPIPDLLLKLRAKATAESVPSPGSPPMAPFADLATSPVLWRSAMRSSRALNFVPNKAIPIPALQSWLGQRTLPKWRGGAFRSWMRKRESPAADATITEKTTAPSDALSLDWDAQSVVAQKRLALPTPIENFIANQEQVNGRTFRDLDTLRQFLVEGGHTTGYCDPALREKIGQHLENDLTVHYTYERALYDDYAFGITRATGAIAESGSIVLSDKVTSHRLAALAPWVHIACLDESQIHRTISDAIAAFGDEPNIIWATGPSKTADIEGILIEGVHGPGEQIALFL